MPASQRRDTGKNDELDAVRITRPVLGPPVYAGANSYGNGMAVGSPLVVAAYGAPPAMTLQTVTPDTAYQTNTAVHLSWSAVPNASGYMILLRSPAWDGRIWHYCLFLDGSKYVTTTTTNVQSFLIYGATTYQFEIQTVNGSMFGPMSNVKGL
jgi:hypothetical protein